MKVRGLDIKAVEMIAERLGLELENVHQVGRFLSFKLTPPHSGHYYARTSARGTRGKWASWEGFRDFVVATFHVMEIRYGFGESQNFRIDSALGTWESPEEFFGGIPMVNEGRSNARVGYDTPQDLLDRNVDIEWIIDPPPVPGEPGPRISRQQIRDKVPNPTGILAIS